MTYKRSSGIHVEVVICFVFLTSMFITATYGNGDYYKVLGVSRSASSEEIRSAYRALAKKWHPDRNPSEEASRKFMEIGEAYETLSDPKTRHEYDTFGTTTRGGGKPPPGHQKHPYHFMHAPFEDLFSFFPGYQHHEFSKNVVEIDFRSYRLKHLPHSRSTPLMLMGYSSTFCPLCQRLLPLWSQLADGLTSIGVTVAAANLQRDAALRDELRAAHVPCIVFVLDGKVSFYSRNSFSFTQLVDELRNLLLQANPSQSFALPKFLSISLDTPLTQPVNSEAAFRHFHAGWRRDSRPRMLFLKPLAVPTLTYLLAAFRAVDHIAAGFVNTESVSARKLASRFGVPLDEESLLIFHENPDRPVSVLTAPKLPPARLDPIIQAYSQLSVPRVYSTGRLLDLCPADGSAPLSDYAAASEARQHGEPEASRDHVTHRHVCLLLLLHSRKASVEVEGTVVVDHWLALLDRVASRLRAELEGYETAGGVRYHLQPVHVYADRQEAWLRHFSTSQVSLETVGRDGRPLGLDLSHPSNIGRLAVIWRVNSRRTAIFLPEPNSAAHPVNHHHGEHRPLGDTPSPTQIQRMSEALIDQVLHSLSHLATFARQQQLPTGWYLADNLLVEDLVVDELAAPLWLRLCHRLAKWAGQVGQWFLVDFIKQPFTFVTTAGAAIFGLLIFAVIQSLANRMANIGLTETNGGRDQRRQRVDESRSSSSRTSPTAQAPAADPQQRRRHTEMSDNETILAGRESSGGAPLVLSLDPSTYDSMVLKATRGRQLLILCVRGSPDWSKADQRLCSQFSDCVRCLGDTRIRCSRLSMESYAGWLAKLLQSAGSGIPIRVRRPRQNEDADSDAVCITPANCVGTVLAVNPARQYFHLYHPCIMGGVGRGSSFSSPASSSDDDNDLDTKRPRKTNKIIRRRHVFASALGLDSDDEPEWDLVNKESPRSANFRDGFESQPSGPLYAGELLAGLPNWLDRFFEGSLTRYQVSEWPINLMGNSAG